VELINTGESPHAKENVVVYLPRLCAKSRFERLRRLMCGEGYASP
jgi:hypothetical protein